MPLVLVLPGTAPCNVMYSSLEHWSSRAPPNAPVVLPGDDLCIHPWSFQATNYAAVLVGADQRPLDPSGRGLMRPWSVNVPPYAKERSRCPSATEAVAKNVTVAAEEGQLM